MNVLVVFAHPEPRSLNGSLNALVVDRLRAFGHEVRISDLYAMDWKASADGGDFPARDAGMPVNLMRDSGEAFTTARQAADIAAEQEKLRWADGVILQFPLWWFSMPAILKGWVERVYAYRFAYGLGEHSDRRWGDRYGEGPFVGKRAMLLVTAGGWEPHYSERGINGPMDDLLFPINHGVLYYPGFDVLPPFIVYRAGQLDAAGYGRVAEALTARLRRFFTDSPIAYRAQNSGDYEIPALTLKPEIDGPGPGSAPALRLHVRASATASVCTSADG